MQVHNPNPYHDRKGRFTSAGEQREKPDRQRRFNKPWRMKFDDKPDKTSPSDVYINSALGSTLGHTYSFSGSYRVGNWRRGMDD